jgi:hypothetical protein
VMASVLRCARACNSAGDEDIFIGCKRHEFLQNQVVSVLLKFRNLFDKNRN